MMNNLFTLNVLLLLGSCGLLKGYPSHTMIKNATTQDIKLKIIFEQDRHGKNASKLYTLRAGQADIYDDEKIVSIAEWDENGVDDKLIVDFKQQDSGTMRLTYSPSYDEREPLWIIKRIPSRIEQLQLAIKKAIAQRFAKTGVWFADLWRSVIATFESIFPRANSEAANSGGPLQPAQSESDHDLQQPEDLPPDSMAGILEAEYPPIYINPNCDAKNVLRYKTSEQSLIIENHSNISIICTSNKEKLPVRVINACEYFTFPLATAATAVISEFNDPNKRILSIDLSQYEKEATKHPEEHLYIKIVNDDKTAEQQIRSMYPIWIKNNK